MQRRIVGCGALISACVIGILVGCTSWFAPSIDFVVSTVEGPEPLVVEFTPVSEKSIASCSWTFGDGETSDQISPVHVYRAPGAYTVRLVAEFVDGTTATIEKPDLVDVRVSVGKGEPQYIYWIDYTDATKAIFRGPRGGGEKEQLVELHWSWPIPEAMAVADGWVYWADEASRCLCRVRTDGSDRETLICNQKYVSDLEVVPDANVILWVTSPYDSAGISGSQSGGIFMAFLDDPQPLTLRAYARDAVWFANRIEVDAVGGKMYWSMHTREPSEYGNASIRVSDISGTVTPSMLQSGLGIVYGLAIDAVAGYGAEFVYWTDMDDSWIHRCRTDGTGEETVVQKNAGPLVVDRLEGKVYVLTARGIERANLDGSEQELIYSGRLIRAIALPE
jgi:PKD repeat protein